MVRFTEWVSISAAAAQLWCDAFTRFGRAVLHSTLSRTIDGKKEGSQLLFYQYTQRKYSRWGNECLMYLMAWDMSSAPVFTVVFVSSSRAVLYSLQLDEGKSKSALFKMQILLRSLIHLQKSHGPLQWIVHNADLLNLISKNACLVEI